MSAGRGTAHCSSEALMLNAPRVTRSSSEVAMNDKHMPRTNSKSLCLTTREKGATASTGKDLQICPDIMEKDPRVDLALTQ